MREQDQRLRDLGANALEVVGLTIVVAGVLAGLAVGFGGSLADGVAVAVCRVVRAGDTAGCETPGDENYKPVCTTARSSGTAGLKVDVAFVNVSADYTLMKTVTYDPVTGEKTVKVTAIKGKGVGLGTGVGANTHAGLANAGGGLSGDLNVKGSVGESWSFTGKDAEGEADALIGDLKEQYNIDAVKENGGLVGLVGAGAYDTVAGPDIPEPNVHTYEAELGASGSGNLGGTLGPKTKPRGGKHAEGKHAKGKGPKHAKKGPEPEVTGGAEARVTVDYSEKVTYEVDDKTGDESATIMLKVGGTGGGQLGPYDKRSRVEYAGSMKVTKGPDGKLKSVTLTWVEIVDGKATMTTTEIPTTTDKDREIVRDKLATLAGAGETAAAFMGDGLVPTEDPGEDGDPFQKLLYDKGRTSKVDYAYDRSDKNYGVNVKLGLKAGVGVGITGSSEKATGARYLGAPGPDGTRRFKNYEECGGKAGKPGGGTDPRNGRPGS